MITDAIQNVINVGDIVNVPCVVTGTGGTSTRPTVTLTTKYQGFDGSTDVIDTTLDSNQVIKEK